jgi:hypothetical protein
VKSARPNTRMSVSRRIFWGMMIALLVIGGLLGLGLFLFTPSLARANLFLPVSLHSSLRADYSADERGFLLPQLDLDLAAEAARDRLPTAGPTGAPSQAPFNPVPTLIEILKTPVPTVTPLNAQPSATPQAVVNTPPTATGGPQASPTSQPSPTLGLSPTGTITPTPGTLASRTPTRTSPAPTSPPAGTRTIAPSPTPPSIPSNTPITLPSQTPWPTQTPPPPPTRTPQVIPTEPQPTGYPYPTAPGITPYP